MSPPEESYREWRRRFPNDPIPIRRASQKDIPTWRSLWRGFLFDHSRRDGEFAVSEKTLAFFEGLAWAYVRRERPGIVMMAGWDWGTLMWGAPMAELPFDVSDGVAAHGWGTYVLPSLRRMGISQRLRDHASRELLDQGFDRVVGSTYVPLNVRDKIEAAVRKLDSDEEHIDIDGETSASVESGAGAGFKWQTVGVSLDLKERCSVLDSGE